MAQKNKKVIEVLTSVKYTATGLFIIVAVFISFTYSAFAFFHNSGPCTFNCNVQASFLGDTKVLTPSGLVPIEKLHVGDAVISLDITSGTYEIEYVQKRRAYPKNEFLVLNDSVWVTPEHPLGTVSENSLFSWKRVKSILIGDQLLSISGAPVPLSSIKHRNFEEGKTVYNPQISGNSNYFVVMNDIPVLVHNKSGGGGGATNWVGPLVPPVDVSDLEHVLDFSDFIDGTLTGVQQIMEGPLRISNAGNFTSIIGWSSQYTEEEIAPLVFIPEDSSATVIGADGLPLLAYDDNFDGAGLVTVKCGDTACEETSQHLVTFQSGPSAGSQIFSIDMQVGDDLNPAIVYYDETNGDIVLAKCVNQDCSGATEFNVIESIGIHTDQHAITDIQIAADGRPIIAYRDVTNNILRVAKCQNPSCSNVSIVTPQYGGSSQDSGITGESVSMDLDPSYNPVITYVKGTTLYYIHCADAVCATSSAPVSIDASATVDIADIAFPVGGATPIIAYHDTTSQSLKIAKCKDSDCTEQLITAAHVGSGYDAGIDPSIKIGFDGLPIITYVTTQGYVNTMHCLDISCRTTEIETQLLANARHVSSVIGNDGLLFWNVINNDFTSGQVGKCANYSCATSDNLKLRAIGIGKNGVPPWGIPILPNEDSEYGLYSYASGHLQNNYGIYGYSPSSIGIHGDALHPSNYAGLFYGGIEVVDTLDSIGGALPGTLAVSGESMFEQGVVADGAYPAVDVNISPPVGYTAIEGVVIGIGGEKNSSGIVGYSSGASGLFVDSDNFRHGILGESVTGIGVHGYSQTDDGIEAHVDELLTNAQGLYGSSASYYGIYGSSNYTLNGYEYADPGQGPPVNRQAGIGLYACGTQYAARFDGDIRLEAGLVGGVDSESYVENVADVIIGKTVVPEVEFGIDEFTAVVSACNGAGACSIAP